MEEDKGTSTEKPGVELGAPATETSPKVSPDQPKPTGDKVRRVPTSGFGELLERRRQQPPGSGHT